MRVGLIEILTSKAFFEENGGFFSCGFTIILLSVASAFERFVVELIGVGARRSERKPSDGCKKFSDSAARGDALRSNEILNVRKGFLK